MSVQATKTASGVATANSAETAIVTSDLVLYNFSSSTFEGVEVRGVLSVLTGATVTAIVVTVRQGIGTGGNIVGAARTHTIGAAANAQIPFCEIDPSPTLAGQQYTVTVTQTGGTGAGTVSATITTSPSDNRSG